MERERSTGSGRRRRGKWRTLPDAQKLLAEALKLPASARAKLVARLLESLDGEMEEGVEELGEAEIARRTDELDQGKVTTVPWADVRRELHARGSQ